MSAAKPKFKGQRFTTAVGRASFPAIFKPKLKYQAKNNEMEYSIEVLFDENTDHKDFQNKCDLALAEVYGSDKKKWPKNISYPLIDQEVLIEKYSAKGQSTDHLKAGAMYARFKTNAKSKPLVVDRDHNEILDETKVYGGCYVRVSGQIKVNPIVGKDPVTKKDVLTVYVTPYLSGVQFVKDGPSFGGRPSAQDMFEAVPFEDDDTNADDLIG